MYTERFEVLRKSLLTVQKAISEKNARIHEIEDKLSAFDNNCNSKSLEPLSCKTCKAFQMCDRWAELAGERDILLKKSNVILKEMVKERRKAVDNSKES